MYIYVWMWFLPSHHDHRGIRFTKKHPDRKQDNGCMTVIFSNKNGFNLRTSECNGCKNIYFVRSMFFDPNEPCVKRSLTGSEACPNDIWRHTRWFFHRPSVTWANALGYSYHLNIWSDPQRNQSWILCPTSVWAQTPFVYCKAEIRSAHTHIYMASSH